MERLGVACPQTGGIHLVLEFTASTFTKYERPIVHDSSIDMLTAQYLLKASLEPLPLKP